MPLRCAVSAEYRGFWAIYGCGQMESRAAASAVTERRRHRWGKQRCGLLADAEAGEDAAQQIIRREGPGDLAQRLLGLTQVFGALGAGRRSRKAS